LPYGNAPANWGIDRTDLWWNPAESGWGLTLAQHGNNTVAAWYTYAPSGRPLFLYMSGVQAQSADAFTGLSTRRREPHTRRDVRPRAVPHHPVGSVTVHFTAIPRLSLPRSMA
jgi:hypothetical protein